MASSSRWPSSLSKFILFLSAIYLFNLFFKSMPTVSYQGEERPWPPRDMSFPHPMSSTIEQYDSKNAAPGLFSGGYPNRERHGQTRRVSLTEESDSHDQDETLDASSNAPGKTQSVGTNLSRTAGDAFHWREQGTRKDPSLSTVFPHGGNTLPNYLLHGHQEGISPGHYRNGTIMFLHHNKAAGSTIKHCLMSMIDTGTLKNRSFLIVASTGLKDISPTVIREHDILVGGYTFGLCERFQGENCSYFTILREPYDRVISSYFYCMKRPGDQLCGPVKARDLSIQQWAIYQGSYFFHQILIDEKYCKPNKAVAELFRNGVDDPTVPPDIGRHISLARSQRQCWFKQRIYLNAFLNQTGREVLLQHVLENLETWFSVIGLTEEFDISLRMLSVTYDIPFYQQCRGKTWNRRPGTAEGSRGGGGTEERMKLELRQSPEVAEALRYDIEIYERGKDIFRRQMEQMKNLGQETGEDSRI